MENQTKIAQQHGSLQGVPLTGLGEAGLEVISRYVDITGDIQVAAILGSTTRRPSTQVTRWIEDYRDMLDAWKLYRARVMFDMSRGNIARWYGDEIRTPKQVVVRCNFCQKNITGGGAREQTVQSKTRVSSAGKLCELPSLTGSFGRQWAVRLVTIDCLAVSSVYYRLTWYHLMGRHTVSPIGYWLGGSAESLKRSIDTLESAFVFCQT